MSALPKWRVFSWVIVIINVLFLAWVIAGANSASSNCNGLAGQALKNCQTGTAVGATIGIGLIIFLWAFVDIILGILWLVTRPKSLRQCPVCGTDVKAGLTVCKKCGHDFAAPLGVPVATSTLPPMPPA